MNEKELKFLWQASNEKLEQSLVINKKNTEEITRMKVQSFLSSMKPTKFFALITGMGWVFAIGSLLVYLFVHAYEKVSLFFFLSATIQVVLTAIAIVIYLYQLILIYNTDFGEPVLDIQKRLSKLKTSTLNVTRLLFLQLPVWTTFYLSKSMFVIDNLPLLVVQGIITILFTAIAIWLFINIKYENRNKKWFQWIFSGKEWQPILQAMELLHKVEQYQNEKNEDSSQ